MTNATTEVALRLAALESDQKNRTPQLAYATIEAGSIQSADEYDVVKGSFGQQFDGSHMPVAYTGNTPLTPTAPILTVGAGSLRVRWDGLWTDGTVVPLDFTRVEIHISDTSGFAADTAATLYATIESPRGGEPSFTKAAGTVYVKLRARNLAGAVGPASAEATIVVPPILGESELAAIQTQVDDATDAAAAAQATATAAADDVAGATAAASAASDAAAAAQADVDAVPGLIATAKSEAITAAAGDATTKANAAETDAIAAAAADATSKANAAQAAAQAASIPAVANAVTTTYINDNAITTPKITANAVTATQIATDAVTAGKILAGAVTAGKIATDAVTAGTIAAGAVTAGKIGALAVIAGTIAADAVTATTIAANAVVAGKIATDAVVAGNILAGAVTAGKLAANSVIAGNIAADAVTANTIAAGSIVASKLAIADVANMAQINEQQSGVIPNHTIITDGSGVRWSARVDTSQTFLFRTLSSPIPFKTGDRLRIVFTAVTASGTNSATPRVRYTDATGWNLTAVGSSPTTIDTTVRDFVYEGVVPSGIGANLSYSIGFASSAGVDIRVRDMRAYRMGAGELVVDGTIVAGKLATDSVLAANVKAGEITAGKLAALSVIAGNIAANAVTASTIAAGAITTDKLDANAINGITITGSTLQTATSGARFLAKPGTATNGFGNGVVQIYSGNSSEDLPAEIYTIADGPNPADNISLMIQAPRKTGFPDNRPFIQMFADDSDTASAITAGGEIVTWQGAISSRLKTVGTGTASVPNAEFRVDMTAMYAMFGGASALTINSDGTNSPDVKSAGASVNRGWMREIEVTGSSATIGTTAGTATTIFTTAITLTAGRKYKIYFEGHGQSSVAGDRAYFIINCDGTDGVFRSVVASAAGIPFPVMGFDTYAPATTGSKTIIVKAYRAAGTGNFIHVAAAGIKAKLLIEDIGAA